MVCRSFYRWLQWPEEPVFLWRIFLKIGIMGASIRQEGKIAVVEGCGLLHGADVCAEDLRGGAGLVLAALAAQGTSRIEGIEWIERGYEHFCENLTALGAEIWKK